MDFDRSALFKSPSELLNSYSEHHDSLSLSLCALLHVSCLIITRFRSPPPYYVKMSFHVFSARVPNPLSVRVRFEGERVVIDEEQLGVVDTPIGVDNTQPVGANIEAVMDPALLLQGPEPHPQGQPSSSPSPRTAGGQSCFLPILLQQ